MTTHESTRDNSLPDLEDRVVDAAIAMAEEVGWENVRLRIVAERLDIPLADLASHFRDLDAVANAWFRRARQQMLDPVPPEFGVCPRASVWKHSCCAGSMRRPRTVGSACRCSPASCGPFIHITGCR